MGKASAESMIVVAIMLLCTFLYLRLLEERRSSRR